MCNLHLVLYLLLILCSVQILIVYRLIQVSNERGDEEGLSSLIKAVENQNRLLSKRYVPFLKKQPKSMYGRSTSSESTTSPLDECEVLEVAIVAAGSTSVRTVQPLLKSLLFFRRRNPIHLHLVVDPVSELIFHRLLSSWAIPLLNYSFYSSQELKPQVDWIPNLHYSGVYGLMKLLLVDALPQHLSKVIVLDTDITCNSDIAELWNFFRKFNSKQALGLIDNQSNWYLRPLHWPALGRGFNTGVVLMHLDALRALNWNRLWRNVTRTVLRMRFKAHLADQDVFNAVLKWNPHLVYQLPCVWNVQLNENALSQWCYLREDSVLKMIHWNSPAKDRVRNRDSDTFRKTYLAFAEYDGGLLQKEIFGCQMNRSIQPFKWRRAFNGRNQLCADMRMAGSRSYRTHLFYLDFDDFRNSSQRNDVTFTTQLSVDRIVMLETIANQWPGSISAAIYASDAEAYSLADFVRSSQVLSRRKNIGYHIVYKQGSNWQTFYPVNYLRNVAMEQIQTDFQLISDVDFVPQMKLREHLMQQLYSLNITVEDKKVLVVPAFETTLHRFFLPIYKKLLLTLWDRNLITPFRFGVWKAGQMAVNYTHWRNAVEPYAVNWTQYFEPFVLVSKLAPRFHTRFVGFGWNKVAYTITLHTLGYEFIVLPDAFLVHLPHSPSLSNNKYRLDYRYRRCSFQLKKEFLDEIQLRNNITNSNATLAFDVQLRVLLSRGLKTQLMSCVPLPFHVVTYHS